LQAVLQFLPPVRFQGLLRLGRRGVVVRAALASGRGGERQAQADQVVDQLSLRVMPARGGIGQARVVDTVEQGRDLVGDGLEVDLGFGHVRLAPRFRCSRVVTTFGTSIHRWQAGGHNALRDALVA
jgi:hypothetical protein